MHVVRALQGNGVEQAEWEKTGNHVLSKTRFKLAYLSTVFLSNSVLNNNLLNLTTTFLQNLKSVTTKKRFDELHQ